MAWTTPRTWTTGELVTKTIMDTHVRDNLSFLGAIHHSIWAQPHAVSGTGAVLATTITGYSNVGVAELVDSQDDVVYFSVPIPTDFVTLTKAAVVLVPGGTGNMRVGATSTYGAAGELMATHGDLISLADVAVTIDLVTERSMSAMLTLLAAGDRLGLKFSREGTHANDTVGASVFVLGLLLEYQTI